MRAVSQEAKKILDILVGKMGGGYLKLDNAPGTYMPLVVEKIGETMLGAAPVRLYSVAHYGEQNGDLMRDPDVVLMRAADENYYPVSFRNDYMGLCSEAVTFEDGHVKGFSPKAQKEIAVFMTSWMRNVKLQQLN